MKDHTIIIVVDEKFLENLKDGGATFLQNTIYRLSVNVWYLWKT
jgi:hypothetical protein